MQRFVARAAGRPGDLAILDVGCGDGQLLAKLRRPGWRLAGLEPDAACAERVRARLGIDVRRGVLRDRLFDPPFDVVTMVHVLEHVPDPAGDLLEVRRLLGPGGVLIVEVPACDSYGFALARHRWFGLDLPRHLTHFSTATLRRIVERAGFRVRDLHRKPTPAMDLAMIHPRLATRELLNAAWYPAAWFLHKLFRGSVVRMVASRD
jgi:SAM-dependent methyltransferase